MSPTLWSPPSCRRTSSKRRCSRAACTQEHAQVAAADPGCPSRLDDAGPPEARDGRRAVSGDASEHLFGVLAQKRRGGPDGSGCPLEAEGDPGQCHASGRWVREGNDHPASLEVRARQDLTHGSDLTAGDPRTVHPSDPLLARALGHDLAENRNQFIPMLHALGAVVKRGSSRRSGRSMTWQYLAQGAATKGPSPPLPAE